MIQVLKITLAITIVYIFISILQGCGYTHTHYQHRTKTQTVLPCTVRPFAVADALVTCPDGTQVLIRANTKYTHEKKTVVTEPVINVIEDCDKPKGKKK